MLSVASLLFRGLVLVRVSNTENAKKKSISCLNISRCFNQCLPFLNHGTKFVRGQIHSVKVGQHVVTLDIFWNQLKLSERPLSIIVILQICQRHFKNTALQALRRDLCNYTNHLLPLIIILKTFSFLIIHSLVPWVRLTSVFPTWRTLKMDGALTSYQSFLVNGSILHTNN